MGNSTPYRGRLLRHFQWIDYTSIRPWRLGTWEAGWSYDEDTGEKYLDMWHRCEGDLCYLVTYWNSAYELWKDSQINHAKCSECHEQMPGVIWIQFVQWAEEMEIR